MNVRVLPYGDRAVLVEPDGAVDVLALAETLRDEPGVVEVVPGARTVLVSAEAGALAGVRAGVDRVVRVARRSLSPPNFRAPAVVLDVRYDGADLATTAADLGLSADGLVRAHAAGDYVVAFCGFVPGFAYLTGLDPALHAARRAEPRTRVPAGSVGVAGEFTGVYPRASPGGWRLLGTTDAPLWDADRDPPALLPPGTRVRFRAR